MSKKQASTRAKKDRSSRKRRVRRGALVLASAATAATMAVAPITPTPEASADIDLVDLINLACGIATCHFDTAGFMTIPIMNFASLLYSIPFLSEGEDPILPPGVVDLPGINLPLIGQILGPTNINALVPGIVARFSPTFFLSDAGTIASILLGYEDDTTLGVHVSVGFMDGALTLGNAITPLQNAMDPGLFVNGYAFVLVRNPGRANGGIAARFDPLLGSFGGSIVSGNVASKDGSGFQCIGGNLCKYIPIKLDAGLGYDGFSDFPVSPWASISIINSIIQANLPTNLIGERETVMFDAGNNNIYVTIVPEDSAILEPIRIFGRPLDLIGIPINPFFAFADALEPAMDVLINVGYTDVNLDTYERSFDQFNSPNVPFQLDDPGKYFTATGVAFSKAIDGIIGLITSGFGLFGANPALAKPVAAAPQASSAAPAAAAASAAPQEEAPAAEAVASAPGVASSGTGVTTAAETSVEALPDEPPASEVTSTPGQRRKASVNTEVVANDVDLDEALDADDATDETATDTTGDDTTGTGDVTGTPGRTGAGDTTGADTTGSPGTTGAAGATGTPGDGGTPGNTGTPGAGAGQTSSSSESSAA